MCCPRCGFAEATTPSCPRCGVVFAKLREDRPRPVPASARPAPEPEPPASHASTWGIWAGVIAMTACALAIGWVQANRPVTPAATAPSEPAAAAERAADLPAIVEAPLEPPPAPLVPPSASGLGEADRAAATALIRLVNTHQAAEADVAEGIALLSRHPDDTDLQKLVLELLLSHGSVQAQQRRYKGAVATLRRAAALPWADRRARMALLSTLVTASEWSEAEAYARQLVGLDPRDAEAWYSLGYALFRLDRNREAVEALKTCNEIRGDSRVHALIARIEKNAFDEHGMMAQNVSHFHVRYDGDEHLEVGREIVQALERHYATLVTAVDHRPPNAIPVILFSGEKYHDAAGAPAWAGGSFHHDDGRIRMPIGGLTRSLTSGIDATLMHELTHAFIYDKTRGVAPRDVNEGFAQYMEGERLSTTHLTRLARGQIGGVHGFYMGALSFVEYLIATRGLGGMNDLFKAMGETGNVDAAFRQVHGSDYTSVQKAWQRRLQQQHGS